MKRKNYYEFGDFEYVSSLLNGGDPVILDSCLFSPRESSLPNINHVMKDMRQGHRLNKFIQVVSMHTERAEKFLGLGDEQRQNLFFVSGNLDELRAYALRVAEDISFVERNYQMVKEDVIKRIPGKVKRELGKYGGNLKSLKRALGELEDLVGESSLDLSSDEGIMRYMDYLIEQDKIRGIKVGDHKGKVTDEELAAVAYRLAREGAMNVVSLDRDINRLVGSLVNKYGVPDCPLYVHSTPNHRLSEMERVGKYVRPILNKSLAFRA